VINSLAAQGYGLVPGASCYAAAPGTIMGHGSCGSAEWWVTKCDPLSALLGWIH